MSSLSQSVVDFIAGLQPLYTCQHADGHECALSLLDGTLILPVDEGHDTQQEGWVAVYWQGDCLRRSEVPGAQLASVAIWRHVQLHTTDGDAEGRAELRAQLTGKFIAATGMPLRYQPPLAA